MNKNKRRAIEEHNKVYEESKKPKVKKRITRHSKESNLVVNKGQGKELLMILAALGVKWDSSERSRICSNKFNGK